MVRQWPMVVAGRLEPDPNRQTVAARMLAKRWKSSSVFMIVNRRRRFLPGTPISTSWRCLEMSMATSKVEAVVSVAVIAGLLSGVVVQNHC
jgi:hypothetical protein